MLKNVISDFIGQNGQKIIKAILDGERDAAKLAELCNRRLKADPEVIAGSLDGVYREDRLFLLKFNFEAYNNLTDKLDEIDREIEKHLLTFKAKG